MIAALLCPSVRAQHNAVLQTPRQMLTQNQGWPKGGVGIITSELYISLKSANNELLLGSRGHWIGKRRTDRQVVVYSNGRLQEFNQLDKDFDLRKAILVSFEGHAVRFFDFDKNEGGFYLRLGQEN
jgi:hypothetical protein